MINYRSGIHRNCSNVWPLACMRAVHRRTIDCRIHSKIPGMSAMVPAATVILVTRSSSVSTTVSYSSCFMWPERKKSRHVRSGDLGGQTTGPPRPIHRFGYQMWFLTAMLKWVGAISIHRPVYQMRVSHFSMRKPLHVHCGCCHEAVMVATESVRFQADLRAVLNASTHCNQRHRYNSLRQHHYRVFLFLWRVVTKLSSEVGCGEVTTPK